MGRYMVPPALLYILSDSSTTCANFRERWLRLHWNNQCKLIKLYILGFWTSLIFLKYPRALWDQGKSKLQPLIFKLLNTQIKETHSRFLWTALLGPNFPVVGQKSNVCLKEKRLRQLKSVITLYWIKSGSTFIRKVIQFPRKYRPCYTQAMHPKVQTVLLPLNAQQKKHSNL